MTASDHSDPSTASESSDSRLDPETKAYLRFGAMILTAMGVMYALTYTNTFEWAHIHWSEERLFVTLLMGGSMAIIMLLFMLHMYRNPRINAGILVGSLLLMSLSVFLIRSQTTVQDAAYMGSMIPHHSIAILTSERSEISDHRVCELAVGIIEAQRREIAEMEWLLADIAENGVAATAAEAESRPVPEFGGRADRSC